MKKFVFFIVILLVVLYFNRNYGSKISEKEQDQIKKSVINQMKIDLSHDYRGVEKMRPYISINNVVRNKTTVYTAGVIKWEAEKKGSQWIAVKSKDQWVALYAGEDYPTCEEMAGFKMPSGIKCLK